MFGSALALAPIVFAGGLFFGYAVLNCSDSAFWQGVEPANELYAKVKYECGRNNCPRSENDLIKLDPPLYRQIQYNAKSKYSYDMIKRKFTWYVRPSLYYLVSFEGNGYGVFKIPQLIPIDHWYIPEYKGKNEELPD